MFLILIVVAFVIAFLLILAIGLCGAASRGDAYWDEAEKELHVRHLEKVNREVRK